MVADGGLCMCVVRAVAVAVFVTADWFQDFSVVGERVQFCSDR